MSAAFLGPNHPGPRYVDDGLDEIRARARRLQCHLDIWSRMEDRLLERGDKACERGQLQLAWRRWHLSKVAAARFDRAQIELHNIEWDYGI